MNDYIISNRKAAILVVDDEPLNLTLICGVLAHDYSLHVSTSGARALEIANSDTPPDLILLDIKMPDMDGYEVCRRLKNNSTTANIPIIFLSALTDTQSEHIGLELGAVDYISKPFSPMIVLARVKSHLLLKISAEILRNQ